MDQRFPNLPVNPRGCSSTDKTRAEPRLQIRRRKIMNTFRRRNDFAASKAWIVAFHKSINLTMTMTPKNIRIHRCAGNTRGRTSNKIKRLYVECLALMLVASSSRMLVAETFASEVRVDLRDWSLSPPSEIAKTGNSPYKKIISTNNSMRMFANTIQKNRRIWQTGYRKEFQYPTRCWRPLPLCRRHAFDMRSKIMISTKFPRTPWLHQPRNLTRFAERMKK